MHSLTSRTPRFSSLLTATIIASLLLVTIYIAGTPSKVHAATRDPLQWPFAPTSIWNMPLGSNARYVDASIPSRAFGTDIDWFIVTHESDPQVPMYMPPTFGAGRCAGTTAQQQAQWHPEAAEAIHVPNDLLIPDAITSGGIYWTPNSSSAFLKPDGKTLVSFNVTARCQAGGPLYGNWFGETDLYGDGNTGGHGGSALSSIGGSIRTGELLGDQPLHHALKIDIWGDWMYYNAANGQGHRWPAPLADGGAPQQYKGSNPALVMGSLLALAPDVSPESLGVTSAIGKKVFYALQNYGAYVVDDTGGDYNALCVEHNADVEFQNATGHTIDKDQALIADFNKMIAAIKVVDNNAQDSIGGGGTPRVALAPEFGAQIPQAQPTPTPAPAKATPTPKATATRTPTDQNHRPVIVGMGTKTASTPTQVSGKPTNAQGPIVSSTSNTTSSSSAMIGQTPWGLLPLALLLIGGGGWLWWRQRRKRASVPSKYAGTTATTIKQVSHSTDGHIPKTEHIDEVKTSEMSPL